MSYKVPRHVLFCVLNWGLGHASRSAVLISLFIDKGIKVTIGSDGPAMSLLKDRFPEANLIELPGYGVSYTRNPALLPLKLLSQAPRIFNTIKSEKKQIDQLLNKEEIELIISDSRIGCYSKYVPSVFLAHQLTLKLPFVISKINQVYHSKLRRFHQVWLPDLHGNSSISGDLGQLNSNLVNIGLLSSYVPTEVTKDIDLLIVCSGPEPQRGIFEKLALSKLHEFEGNMVIVRGTRRKTKIDNLENLEVVDLAGLSEMNDLLNRSKKVLSRAGYSSIMDYKVLGKPAVLIPTPGQTEQLYLAKHLANEAQFSFLSQKEFREANLGKELSALPNEVKKENLFKMEEVIKQALENLQLSMPT